MEHENKRLLESLSVRLQTLISLIPNGRRVADIGCDHGYVSICLLQEGIAAKVIAMDVRKGPLDRAKEHIAEYGYADRIETRLSDGMDKLNQGETDAVILAGMGGKLMISILERGARIVHGMKDLILQPQSDIDLVRNYISRIGFEIYREEMVLEDGKFYPMMHAVPAAKAVSYTEEEALFGPCLLKKAHPVLLCFLEKEKTVQETILASLPEGEEVSEQVRLRKEQIKDYLEKLERAQQICEHRKA